MKATKTRCKVSAKSELKAERKEAAEGYKSPNLRHRNKCDKLFFAETYRVHMLRNLKELIEWEDSKDMRRHYLHWYFSWKADYKTCVLLAAKYRVATLPLP